MQKVVPQVNAQVKCCIIAQLPGNDHTSNVRHICAWFKSEHSLNTSVLGMRSDSELTAT